MKKLILSIACVCIGTGMLANNLQPSLAAIDYSGFQLLTKDVNQHRAKRLVNLDKFLGMAKDKNTIILDTRSEKMFDNRHIKGAVHLNFSDFTQQKLKKLIQDKNTRILIYCNNNFTDDPAFFALKAMPLALNIPTYINLFGYGYKNVYELNESVSVNDPRLRFSGNYSIPEVTEMNSIASIINP